MMKNIVGILTFVLIVAGLALPVCAADSPTRIMPDAVKARMDSNQPIVFIDTRNGDAWSSSSKKIPGSIRVRSGEEFSAILKALKKDDFIVTYCT